MKKMSVLTVSIAMALLAPLASAADSGWYMGAGGGATSYNGTGKDFAPLLPGEVLVTTSLKDTSTGYKLYGGKQFTENWGVELAYTSLGKFSRDATVTGGTAPLGGTEYGEVKPECWSLSAVGTLPVGNNFSLMGKAGLCRWDDTAKAYETAAGTIYPELALTTGTNLTFGLGAKYNFSNNWAIRAEWEDFDHVVHNSSSVHMWSGSIQYGF
jgi:OOP family OmpA-OmpF porin